ncbi:MAG TPA: hypothetical protein VGO82_02895, partial [Enterovirga sp.]|nr:hypothetical protein [Enterovirga sp.]
MRVGWETARKGQAQRIVFNIKVALTPPPRRPALIGRKRDIRNKLVDMPEYDWTNADFQASATGCVWTATGRVAIVRAKSAA